jgi:hypothetical protein
VRIDQRHPLRDHAARRATGEGRFFDPDPVHERIHVGGEVVGRVAASGLI